MRSILGGIGAVCIAIVSGSAVQAATVSKTVNASDPYIGFMNVSNLPVSMGGDGAYQFGSSWGTADLRASFTGPVLKLQANNINDPSTYWYQGGGAPGAPGNKIMDASMYVDSPVDVAHGDTLVFGGTVLANTLVSPYTSVAFIKDFAPDYSSFVSTTVPLTPGNFSVSMVTNPDPARHIQYGFETIGPNAWGSDADAKGFVTVTASVVPEPVSVTAIAATGLLLGRRRRA